VTYGVGTTVVFTPDGGGVVVVAGGFVPGAGIVGSTVVGGVVSAAGDVVGTGGGVVVVVGLVGAIVIGGATVGVGLVAGAEVVAVVGMIGGVVSTDGGVVVATVVVVCFGLMVVVADVVEGVVGGLDGFVPNAYVVVVVDTGARVGVGPGGEAGVVVDGIDRSGGVRGDGDCPPDSEIGAAKFKPGIVVEPE
jgi:hypothetical protein